MGCSIRRTRHGYLAFRLLWDGLDVQEGTLLLDTLENRAKVEAQRKVIDDEIRAGRFDYLRWFEDGSIAHRFRQPAKSATQRVITVRGFFIEWGGGRDPADGATNVHDKQVRYVSRKWASNRASLIRTHVLPALGPRHLDDLAVGDLTQLQRDLVRRRLSPATVDRVVHSALRAMLRDAGALGYRAAP